jgi:hypothetical protein
LEIVHIPEETGIPDWIFRDVLQLQLAQRDRMKVITPGRQQKGWATETTCTGKGNGGGGCGALLLVDEGDLYKTFTGANYGGDTPEPVATFKCAACGVLTDLENFPRDKLRELSTKKPDPDGVL